MIYTALEGVGLVSFAEVSDQMDGLRKLLAGAMPHEHIEIMVDLVAMSAAEIQVVGSGVQRKPEFPVVVREPSLRFALAKTDTLPTWPCRTPERIAGGRAQITDCFAFAGDLDKALAVGIDSPAKFRGEFVGYVGDYVSLMTNTPIGKEASIAADAYLAEALVWRARLEVFERHQDVGRTAVVLRDTAKAVRSTHLLRA